MAIVNDATVIMKVPAALVSSGTVVISEFGNQLAVDAKGYCNVPQHLVSKYLNSGWSLESADVAANES